MGQDRRPVHGPRVCAGALPFRLGGGGPAAGQNTGLAHAFASAADRTATARILAAAGGLSALALVCIGRIPGLAMAAAALVVLAWYRRLALREFGGLSGDLAGWFVQWCELAQLAALVLTRALLALL